MKNLMCADSLGNKKSLQNSSIILGAKFLLEIRKEEGGLKFRKMNIFI